MATAISQELEEEFLSTIRKGQEIALEALRPLVETVHYVIPAMPVVPCARQPADGCARSRGRRVRLRRAPACLTSGSLPTR
jgi:hypothetical protein